MLTKSPDRRITILLAIALIWVMVIGVQLVRLQVARHDQLRERAERQHQFVVDVSPTRGVIYDRNGHQLARSAEVPSLFASPSQIADKAGAAAVLARLLNLNKEILYKRFTSDRVMVVVKRKLNEREVAAVKELGLPGLSFVNEMKRFYLNGRTAAHVLGFVDIDERGLAGVELSYDGLIRGRGGRLVVEVDAFKRPYNHKVEELTPGANLTLTIDTMIQHDVEGVLERAVRSTGASSGMVVMVKPATGEVLAMASYPTFDPNNPADSEEEWRTNRAVEAAYEPGSIFKIVTYAAAIEEELIGARTLIDCGAGQLTLYDRRVRDGQAGLLTASRALEKSSNVAAVKIAQNLGRTRLSRYIEMFGFGRRTGVELPGESRGILREVKDWSATSIAAVPLGHEIGVTALQAAAAVATIANGGEWVQPHIVKRVISPAGEVLGEHNGERRQVVSQRAAAELTAMLENVVVRGTGQPARIEGYRVAGKTGTAQKVDRQTGRYSTTRYVASFVGFAPADNPEVACVVSIEEPRGAHSGRDVAAPVFARVVAKALQRLGVPPQGGASSRPAADRFTAYDIPRRIVPMEEVPPAEAGDPPAPSAGDQRVLVPDLIGRGLREAALLCGGRRLKIKATGEGVVSRQSPPPGTLTQEGSVCYLTLSRHAVRRRVEAR